MSFFILTSIKFILLCYNYFKLNVLDKENEILNKLLINDSDYSAGSKIEHYLDDNVEFYYFTYTAVIVGDEFAYFVAVYDSEYYYYVVNFFCLETNFKRWSKKYMEWAKTVKIA